MNNKNNLIIIILLIIAIVLGILVFNKNKETNVVSDNEDQTPNNEIPQENIGGGAPQNINLPDSLSEEEKFVLVVPFDGTQEEKQKHFETAERLAVDGNEIDIAGCLGNPLVLRISKESPLRVKNSDDISHSLLMGVGISIDVESGETEVVEGLFDQGGGLYGYGCDLRAGTAGLFLVTE